MASSESRAADITPAPCGSAAKAKNDGAVEREAGLRAVPRDELTVRVVVPRPAAPGRQAAERRRLGVLRPLDSVYTELVFEWDPRKAEANAAKHGVTFDDAVTVFVDPDALDGPDLQHSSAESRYRRIGPSADGRVLIVAYTLRRRWRCRSDPDHQRAAGGPARACGVRGEGLTSRISQIRRRSSWRLCAAWADLRSEKNAVS